MCTNPRQINYRFDKPSDRRYHAYRYDSFAVRCGKCDECLKQKRQGIAVNAYRTACKCPDMVFATFTFDNDSLPMAFRYEYDGTIFTDLGFCPDLNSDDYRQMWFSRPHKIVLIDGKKCIVCDRQKFEVADFDGKPLYVHVTPSLNRYEWRMSIKRSRMRYKREFGQDLKFRYMAIGEYGPRTNRPHFHCLFWNLTEKDAAYLFQDWENNYGHVDWHKVVPRYHKNQNGSVVVDDGKFSCSNYVSKYLVKGECEYIECQDGFCERPRKLISKNIGEINDIEPDLMNHLLGFDVVKYDPNKFFSLSKDLQYKVLNVISRRMYYPINGKPYSLPLNIKRKIFYDVEKQTDGSIRYRPKEVQIALTDFVRTKNDRVFEDKLRSYLQQSSSEDVVSMADKVCLCYENSRHSDMSAYRQDYIQTIQRSKF